MIVGRSIMIEIDQILSKKHKQAYIRFIDPKSTHLLRSLKAKE